MRLPLIKDERNLFVCVSVSGVNLIATAQIHTFVSNQIKNDWKCAMSKQQERGARR